MLDLSRRPQDIMHAHLDLMWQQLVVAYTFILTSHQSAYSHMPIHHTLCSPSIKEWATNLQLTMTRSFRMLRIAGCSGTISRPLSAGSGPQLPAPIDWSRKSWNNWVMNDRSKSSACIEPPSWMSSPSWPPHCVPVCQHVAIP